jgi:hypothetical protein
LTFSKSGNQLTLSWSDTTAILQENADLNNLNGWGNVVGSASSPATITIPASGMKFYRLRRP